MRDRKMNQKENRTDLKPYEETAFSGWGVVCIVVSLGIASVSISGILVFCFMVLAMKLFSVSRKIEKQAHELEELKNN